MASVDYDQDLHESTPETENNFEDASEEEEEEGATCTNYSLDDESTLKKLLSQKWDLVTEFYQAQLQIWPTRGKHILAHYDDHSVVVYQAFKPSIAEYAVKHQRFGGPEYKFTRMSWIKTNFLWMMFRCGWARKHNQECVLAIRITKAGFEQILSKAFTMKTAPDAAMRINNKARLQWDPDHKPDGEHEMRKAIQLGIRGKLLEDFCTKYIIHIKDITDFVHRQHNPKRHNRHWSKQELQNLQTPRERVYVPSNTNVHDQLELDMLPVQTVVSFPK